MVYPDLQALDLSQVSFLSLLQSPPLCILLLDKLHLSGGTSGRGDCNVLCRCVLTQENSTHLCVCVCVYVSPCVTAPASRSAVAIREPRLFLGSHTCLHPRNTHTSLIQPFTHAYTAFGLGACCLSSATDQHREFCFIS